MKKMILLFACMLSILSLQAADISVITIAFKDGSAASLAGYMDTEVDVAVPGTSKKGNGSEAVTILNQFFQTNKSTIFTVAHHADKADSGFVVGKLTTDKGEFRVNVAYIVKDSKIAIQTIRIE